MPGRPHESAEERRDKGFIERGHRNMTLELLEPALHSLFRARPVFARITFRKSESLEKARATSAGKPCSLISLAAATPSLRNKRSSSNDNKQTKPTNRSPAGQPTNKPHKKQTQSPKQTSKRASKQTETLTNRQKTK